MLVFLQLPVTQRWNEKKPRILNILYNSTLLFFNLAFLPLRFTWVLLGSCLKPEISCKKRKEKVALKVMHCSITSSTQFLVQLFSKKTYFDKRSLQLQGEGKNYLSKVFYSNFVTNMAHNELLFVLLVFGTHLTRC